MARIRGMKDKKSITLTRSARIERKINNFSKKKGLGIKPDIEKGKKSKKTFAKRTQPLKKGT